MKKAFLLLITLSAQFISAQSNIKLNEKAPKITVTDWILNVPKDKSLDNKFIVLEFWATWCGPCIEAVPHLNEIQSKFNRKDLYFVAITDESPEKVNRIAKRIPFSSIMVADTNKKTQIAYGNGVDGLDAYPMTVLIDNKGIIKWIGMPTDLTEDIIKELVNNTLKPYNVFESGEVIKMEEEVSFKTELTMESDFQKFINIVKNKNITYHLEIKKTESTLPNSSKMSNNIFHYSSLGVKDIFTEIFGVNALLIETNDKLKDIRYSVTYKNGNPALKKDLEKEFLEILGLSKTSKTKELTLNKVTINNAKLLEEALDKEVSSQSDAGDKIIFSNFSFKRLETALNKKSDVIFEFDAPDEKRSFDFVINTSSSAEIIKSLKAYGLNVKSEAVQKEIIMID